MEEWWRDYRRIGAAFVGFHSAPFKLWAVVRCAHWAKHGKRARLVIWFNNLAFDADQLELCAEPEWAVRHADGHVERCHPPPKPGLRKAIRRNVVQLARPSAAARRPRGRASSAR